VVLVFAVAIPVFGVDVYPENLPAAAGRPLSSPWGVAGLVVASRRFHAEPGELAGHATA
jgi:hypothetical protein